MVAAAASEE